MHQERGRGRRSKRKENKSGMKDVRWNGKMRTCVREGRVGMYVREDEVG
jgi:hypothetical protein